MSEDILNPNYTLDEAIDLGLKHASWERDKEHQNLFVGKLMGCRGLLEQPTLLLGSKDGVGEGYSAIIQYGDHTFKYFNFDVTREDNLRKYLEFREEIKNIVEEFEESHHEHCRQIALYEMAKVIEELEIKKHQR